MPENIEQYELEGNQIFYATHHSDSNLQGMKMIVPAKGKIVHTKSLLLIIV